MRLSQEAVEQLRNTRWSPKDIEALQKAQQKALEKQRIINLQKNGDGNWKETPLQKTL